MKNKKSFRVLILLLPAVLTFAFAFAAPAQSTDRSNPTPLAARETTAKGPGRETDYYYSFRGGPGAVTITLTIRAKQYSTFARLEVTDAARNRLATHNMNAATSGGPEQVVKSIELDDKQTVLLKLTLDANLAEYKIILGGAVEFDKSSSGDSKAAENVNASQAGGNNPNQPATGDATVKIDLGKFRRGQFINLPKSGTLVVQMKDGSRQEIDLRRVAGITLSP